MDEVSKLKNKTLLSTIVVAVAFELISLLVLGWDLKFLYGLALGTSISILSFIILAWTARQVLNTGKKSISIISYIFRLLIYGIAVVAAFKVNLVAGFASIIGIMTTKIALLIVYGILPKFDKNRKVSDKVRKEYELIDKEREEHRGDGFSDKIKREFYYNDFTEDDSLKAGESIGRPASKEVRLKGRTYKTHKRLR